MDAPLLQLLTRGVFILVFGLTLLDYVRSRDLPRLEVAALFGTLALIIASQAIADLTGSILPSWANAVVVLAFLAQPYLLVRVLAQFRPVPRHQQAIALIGLILSWAFYIPFGANLPLWGTLAIVTEFVYVEGYATVQFVQSAFVHRGITQRRLIAVALGSGCLALVIVAAGVISALPETTAVLTPLVDLLAFASAVAYYIGMAPPGWLRRIWQGAEVHRFLLGLSGLSGTQRVTSLLEYLGPAAARATGGRAALIALVRDDGNTLDVFADSSGQFAVEPAAVSALRLDRSPVLAAAWRERTNAVIGPADEWGLQLSTIGPAR